MAGVTPPGFPADYAPLPPPVPEEPRPGRRRWLAGIVVAWSLVLVGAVVWSVRRDPPTVPEQRDIGVAVRVLERAAGLLVAAADGPAQTLEIGALELDRECGLTPVRDGIGATQTILVRVRDGEALAVLESVAARLPGDYDAAVRGNEAGTRFTLRADAGEFVGVDATVREDDTAVALRISTDCRPLADGMDADDLDAEGIGAGVLHTVVDVPDAFQQAIAALGGGREEQDLVRVACPAGNGTAAWTFGATGLRAPADLGQALRGPASGATVVRAGAREWAYRSNEVSVVVTEDGGVATVRATTGCRQ